jgi:hypothetical protein
MAGCNFRHEFFNFIKNNFMPEQGMLFQTNFSEGQQQHHVEVYEAQTTASDMHYYCKIDDDIEVALMKNEQGQWIDIEESAPTELSKIIGPLIDEHRR